MELRWLEDLLALADAETLTAAAERRNTSQSAFTRRIQALEHYLGADVLDRTRRPARMTDVVRAHLEDVRLLVRDSHRLRNNLRTASRAGPFNISTQHAIAVSIAPALVARLRTVLDSTTVRIRTDNRNECYAMLMTSQASLMVAYETVSLPLATDDELLDRLTLGIEELVPVVSRQLVGDGIREYLDTDTLEVISYPGDVFLGEVLDTHVLARLPPRYRVARICETAHTPAVLRLVLERQGIAWLPRSLVQVHIESGALIELSDALGTFSMHVVAARLKGERSLAAEIAWRTLAQLVANDTRPDSRLAELLRPCPANQIPR